MFNACYKLKVIKGINRFNTINVEDMEGMFQLCENLEYIDLSNFNTNNVKNMSHMFFGCSSLKKLNLYNFNFNNVNDMGSIFSGCSSLKELNLNNANFDINNGNKVLGMFSPYELKKNDYSKQEYK